MRTLLVGLLFLSQAVHALIVERRVLQTALQWSEGPDDLCAPLFALVLSAPGDVARRNYVRQMWREAKDGWGRVQAKFAICKTGSDGADLETQLQDESVQQDDMLMLDCTEGYKSGFLTAKVIQGMRAFLYKFPEYEYFMKVDDDTFVSTRRLCDMFQWRRNSGKDNYAAYFGVFAEGPHEAINGEHRPIRDPESPWYEPVELFSGELYPVSAKGGPGYILSRQLVTPIIESGIAASNVLYNEDKAVGVWVEQLRQQGQQIDNVNLIGTDGYDEHSESFNKTGTYKDYKMAVHHHLPGATISCLHNIDHAYDPLLLVDNCFSVQEEIDGWNVKLVQDGEDVEPSLGAVEDTEEEADAQEDTELGAQDSKTSATTGRQGKKAKRRARRAKRASKARAEFDIK